MNAGLWMAPALLVGLFVILWAATWLERLVEPPAFDPEVAVPGAVGTGFPDIGAGPEEFGMDGRLGTRIDPRSA